VPNTLLADALDTFDDIGTGFTQIQDNVMGFLRQNILVILFTNMRLAPKIPNFINMVLLASDLYSFHN
jgi:hypothetical protein